MSSDEILKLLAQRHADDVFVPECKDGDSYGSFCRMDAWTMRKSWAHPLTCAYEIKVSRADFSRDTKFRRYIPLCNKFYFVCPWGLIQPNELPDDVGLLWVAKTETRLWEKKKAPHRGTKAEDLEPVFRYLLMARVRIQREMLRDNSFDFWKSWLEKKTALGEVGHRVSKELCKTIHEKILTVEVENARLQAENKKLEAAKKILEELGIDAEYANESRVRSQATRLKAQMEATLPEPIRHSIRSLHVDLGRALERIAEAEQEIERKLNPDAH